MPEEPGKKAIIFDMDGVLVDTESVYLNNFRSFLRNHGKKVNEELLLKSVGADSRMTWRCLASMWGTEGATEEIRELFHKEYPDGTINYRECLFPGIKELLGKLKTQGYCVALASSTRRKEIERMLGENDLHEYFEVIVSGEDFKESKPNPEIYSHTCAELHLSPEECIVVEDSNYGIRAGKAAGMKVIAIKDCRFSQDQSLADYMIENTCDLAELI